MKEKTKPYEIIILALGTSRLQCPYDAEVWSVNMGYQQIAHDHGRIDKIFMVHGQVCSKEGNPYFNWQHFREMKEAGCDIINLHKVKDVPFRRYPFEGVVEKLGLNYFSNTISYMIAYALYKYTKKENGKLVLKQPLKLRLYGVDMWEGGEYAQEKGGVECWLGYALGLGVEVSISLGSSLFLPFKNIPYGLEVPKGHTFDILGLLNGKTPDLEEQREIIAAQLEKRKNSRIPLEKYRGEFSKGLHRELAEPLPPEAMPKSLW